MLEATGYTIAGKAYNGEAALELFNSLDIKPEIILMDHRLPNKSGLEATKEILKIDRSVKIIFTTADTEIKKQALEVGAVCVVTKPFVFGDILNCIEKALNHN